MSAILQRQELNSVVSTPELMDQTKYEKYHVKTRFVLAF